MNQSGRRKEGNWPRNMLRARHRKWIRHVDTLIYAIIFIARQKQISRWRNGHAIFPREHANYSAVITLGIGHCIRWKRQGIEKSRQRHRGWDSCHCSARSSIISPLGVRPFSSRPPPTQFYKWHFLNCSELPIRCTVDIIVKGPPLVFWEFELRHSCGNTLYRVDTQTVWHNDAMNFPTTTMKCGVL